jgi:hypothetical protein
MRASTVGWEAVTNDRSYIRVNDRERERLREFLNRLDDDALAAPANECWTVAGVLGHLAYWDNRMLVVADKIDRGEPWVPTDAEPEGDWLTDSTRDHPCHRTEGGSRTRDADRGGDGCARGRVAPRPDGSARPRQPQ